MANYLVTDTELTQIASAVRSKLGITNSFVYPTGLADAINSITNGKYFYDANFGSFYVYDKFCTSIKTSAFQSCSSLTSVSFPACTTIGPDAFNRCSSLKSVSFPACTTIEDFAFGDCSSLTSVSFPACTIIMFGAFIGCMSLSVIYLAKNSVVTLDKFAFDLTGITSTTGSIRVPSNLVNSYKAAENWSLFSNRIFAI